MLLVIYQDKKKKYEPPIPTRVGKKQKKTKGPDAANKLPQGTFLKDIYITTRTNFLKVQHVHVLDNHVHQSIFLKSMVKYVTFNRVCTGPGKPGKSWNFIVALSRTGKSWKKATGPGKF